MALAVVLAVVVAGLLPVAFAVVEFTVEPASLTFCAGTATALSSAELT